MKYLIGYVTYVGDNQTFGHIVVTQSGPMTTTALASALDHITKTHELKEKVIVLAVSELAED